MNHLTFRTRRVIQKANLLWLLTALGAATLSNGCASDKATPGGSGTDGGGGSCTGGPVPGAADTHCGSTKQAAVSCLSDSADAGASSGDAGAEVVAPVLYNSAADDDDCKYHVEFTVTPICANAGATFSLTLTRLTDGSPVTGADPHIEAYLANDESHIALDTGGPATEKAGGAYDIAGVKLDESGRWTVRFHLFETCSDTPEDSKHGHAAFFIDVP